MLARKSPLNNLGDTIVEVIICIAILGTAMTVAYVSANHSLQLGTDAGNRNRAIGYLQQQVEMIKLAEQSGNGNLSSYIAYPGTPFCIDPSTGGKIPVGHSGACKLCVNSAQSVVGFASSDDTCGSGSVGADMTVIFNDSTNTFQTDIKWESPNGSGFDTSTAYYKISPASAAAPGGGTIVNADIMVQSDINSPYGPKLDVTANGVNIYSNQFGTGFTLCPGGAYQTPAPSFNIAPDDSLGETCTAVSLPLDLSAAPGATQITFSFSHDRDVINPAAPPSHNEEDNNIILRQVSLPGKTLKLHSLYSFGSPTLPPDVPAGSTLPPYSIWMLHDGETVTFDIL